MSRRNVLFLFVLVFVGFSLSFCSCRHQTEKKQPFKDAGSWELPVVVNQGKEEMSDVTIKMPEYLEKTNSKLVLLYFNATWSEPTLAEIPYYQDLYDKYKEQGLAVISIFIDNNENLRPQIINVITKDLKHEGGESGKITFPVCWDLTQKVKEMYGMTSIPVTYLINQENKIVYEHSGFTNELLKELDQMIQSLLAQ